MRGAGLLHVNHARFLPIGTPGFIPSWRAFRPYVVKRPDWMNHLELTELQSCSRHCDHSHTAAANAPHASALPPHQPTGANQVELLSNLRLYLREAGIIQPSYKPCQINLTWDLHGSSKPKKHRFLQLDTISWYYKFLKQILAIIYHSIIVKMIDRMFFLNKETIDSKETKSKICKFGGKTILVLHCFYINILKAIWLLESLEPFCSSIWRSRDRCHAHLRT